MRMTTISGVIVTDVMMTITVVMRMTKVLVMTIARTGIMIVMMMIINPIDDNYI
jgi:hypothetical protein